MQTLTDYFNKFFVSEGFFGLFKITVYFNVYVVFRDFELEAVESLLGQIDEEAKGYVKEFSVFFFRFKHFE